MYEEHRDFIQPEHEDVKVWRYMDFTKFASLINSQRLYFTRPDMFDDPFEGSLAKRNAQRLDAVASTAPAAKVRLLTETVRRSREIWKEARRYVAVNCWHMNDFESAAMWKLYLKSDEGIAIQSTYSKLKTSLIDDEPIHMGKISYIDYETQSVLGDTAICAFMHKRKSFEHEQEIRALITKFPVDSGSFDFSQETIQHGVEIQVDLDALVQCVFVAPSTPEWFENLVKAVIGRYGYSFKVVRSKLGDDPVF